MSAETLERDKKLWEVRSEIFPLLLNSPHLDLLLIVKNILKNADKIKSADDASLEIKRLTRKQEEADLWIAIKQAKNGEVVSLEDAIAKSKTWLK